MNVFYLLLVAAVLLGLQVLVFRRAGHKNIHVTRDFTKKRLFAGESLQMVEVIENRRLLPVPWLRLETRMPGELLFGRQDNLEISGNRYHRSVFFLRPWQRVRRIHEIRATHRGFFQFTSYAMTVGDLVGLSRQTIEKSMEKSIVVYPKLLSREEASLPASRWQGEAIVRRFINPDLFLYNGIRDYAPGDPIRDIHWRAYARSGELKVKQYDYTAQRKYLVLLNVVLDENQWGEINPDDEAKMEYAISLAASLMVYALQDGLEVGFGANGYAKPYEGEAVYLPPASGNQQSELVLESCARLVPKRVKNFHVFLKEMPVPRDTDIVLLTGYTNDMIEAEADRLRAQGNTVTVLPLHREEGRAST